MVGTDIMDMDMDLATDTEVVICIRIRVSGRFFVPVSNTTYDMGKDDTYKLSENLAPNYNAWEFRTRISAQSKDLLEMILDNDPELTTGHNGKIWKAWKSRNDAAAELLVKTLDDNQLIHNFISVGWRLSRLNVGEVEDST